VDISSTIDFPGLVDLRVCGHRFFDEASNLFLICGVPLDGLDDQAMGGTAGLLCQCTEPCT
jgi:hypothetical protein